MSEAEFQSTLPARGATGRKGRSGSIPAFQSTLPARGATVLGSCLPVSIRQFQSTLPARGATCFSLLRTPGPAHFNPRSPHGERLDRYEGVPHYYTFQSTLPARGAT